MLFHGFISSISAHPALFAEAMLDGDIIDLTRSRTLVASKSIVADVLIVVHRHLRPVLSVVICIVPQPIPLLLIRIITVRLHAHVRSPEHLDDFVSALSHGQLTRWSP